MKFQFNFDLLGLNTAGLLTYSGVRFNKSIDLVSISKNKVSGAGELLGGKVYQNIW